MSEWITDRRPTKPDANSYGMVLVQNIDGPLLVAHWASHDAQTNGVPWMPTPEPPEPYVEPKREVMERRTGVLTIKDYADDRWCEKVPATETFPDDPDFDKLIAAATKLIRAASIGDQYFIPSLMGNDPETTKVRHLLVELGDVLRGDDDDDD